MKVDQCYSVILQKIFHQQNLAYPQGTKQETFFVHFQFHRTVLVFPTAHRLSGPSNKLNMGFLRVPWVTFRAWLVTDQFCWTSTWQGGDKRKRIDERGGGGGGDYSREAIILNISIKGGDYSRDGYYSRKYGICSPPSRKRKNPRYFNSQDRGILP